MERERAAAPEHRDLGVLLRDTRKGETFELTDLAQPRRAHGESSAENPAARARLRRELEAYEASAAGRSSERLDAMPASMKDELRALGYVE